MEQDERYKEAKKGAYIGIYGNLLLAIVKLIIGYIGNSKALLADAVHSASDVAGSIAVLFGLRAAKMPPDEDHPYGHGKAESIAAIIVAVLLFIVGIEITKSSITAFFKPVHSPELIALVAAFISIFLKEWMFRYKYALGKRLNSAAIIANAYEHRSDVYSSAAAMVGIGIAILGTKINMPILLYADPAAGLVVAIMILKMAWDIGAESIHTTMDHVLHEEDIEPYKEIVRKVEGVREINTLYAREHGYYVIIDIKVSVDPYITVEEGHRIGKNVKEKLMEDKDVENVFVHINPYNDKNNSFIQ
ncbi:MULTISPECIES: cation diffusion facilitator family transporter [unclassified Bacillus (in: firmicutes)]|uniref:cation diffusion facilitator family transporter n=1 Tax=Bacillaceae TaxID=186817 RepID=UPI000BF16B59|nr:MULTISPECIES: cation diffusion facilitator family transporter [unclassified Bacillus (in: firmicutes)]PEJ51787.1 cation-efflux pump [Bacillus sp. AFS002410]PEK98661.1 cation-efflux pump [Bacillus sp. AFS017336]QKE75514.1 cation transporter [Arthrobacter citreus]